MPVRDLKPSRILAVERFESFEQFRPNDVIGGGTSTPLCPENVSATRAALALPASRLVMQRSFARRLECDMGAPGAALVIPMLPEAYAEINRQQWTGSTLALLRGVVPTHTLEPCANTYVMLRFQSGMQNRGWLDFQAGLELVPIEPAGMRGIQSVLNDIFARASDCVDVRQFAESGEAMQESLLSALDDVLLCPQSIKPSPGSFERHRRLVTRLDDLVHERPATPFSTDSLAHNVGVSVRALQTSVRAVHGVGLHRYATLKRLWLARQQLSRGLSGQNVRTAALAYGFWHMGEFSTLYKATFGESPSETLRRCRV